MSKTKNRAEQRMLLLIKEALDYAYRVNKSNPNYNCSPRLMVNIECGIGHNHPDIQNLLKRGYMTFVRVPYGRVWAPTSHTTNPAKLHYSIVMLTDAGRAFYEKHSGAYKHVDKWTRGWWLLKKENPTNTFKDIRNYI